MVSSRESSPPPPYSSRSASPEPPVKRQPPPLPPRIPKDNAPSTPYSRPGPSVNQYEPRAQSWTKRDPRSSSMQSLRPVESSSVSGRRTLLIIYIHGFMGNESSFKSFPAHVHNILTATLAESHVVHSKIYPRYRSRRPIEYAADDFSNWLCPHENDNTDVILIGHSMGGILAAEVALLRSYSPSNNEALRHRILGVLAFDTPFLGMHPGVIGTGIASLFQPKPESPGGSQGGDDHSVSSPGYVAPLTPDGSEDSSSLFSVHSHDPNFNPTFPNDKRIVDRRGWEKAAYFLYKHSDGLTKATKQYVMSHFEFGGCLADYSGLRRRYTQIRSLEDVDEFAGNRDERGKILRRVRFVNYYSASTGRPKVTKQEGTPATASNSESVSEGVAMRSLSLQGDGHQDQSAPSVVPTEDSGTHDTGLGAEPDDSVDDPEDFEDTLEELDPTPYYSDDHHSVSDQDPTDQHINTGGIGTEASDTATTETGAIDAGPSNTNAVETGAIDIATIDTETDLQSPSQDAGSSDTIPPIPTAPRPFDPGMYSTADTLKAAQKEHSKSVKEYERALKDREKAIRAQEKELKKSEKEIAKEIAKNEKAAAKAAAKADKEQKKHEEMERRELVKRNATINPEIYDRHVEKGHAEQVESGKKKKDRKFCALPPKDSAGQRDSTWIRVYMEGVDEVVAHTTLFLPSETYEKLVGDTTARIETWINEDRTKRLLLQEQSYKEDEY